MQKDFDRWNIIKKTLHHHAPPLFRESQIWWCAVGLNIGDEQDGKGDLFTRPVLVIKKFNRNLFIGIPLSTKQKDNYFYHHFMFKDRQQSALLSHIKLFDAKRLNRLMGELPSHEMVKIKKKLHEILR